MDLTAGPLRGMRLRAGGQSAAARVAGDHLRALGCTQLPATHGDPVSLAVSASESEVDCAVDWAGPVAMTLVDEVTVQAACGVMQVHGRRSGVPSALGVDFASTAAGLLAVQGTLAALLAQARGLDVRHVTTSAAQGALLAVSQYLAAATTSDDWAEPELPGGPPFTSADAVRFEIETFDAEPWSRFWRALGADDASVRQGWRPFLHRFATATCPLPKTLHETTRGHRFAAVADAATATGVSLLRVREQPIAPIPQPPWQVTAMPGAARAPSGQRGPDSAAPLAGVVVVEAGRRVQGPLAAHLLGMLGANVIHVEPPGGDPQRGAPPIAGGCSARFLALNRGKRVVEADLRTSAGRQRVRELVAEADVFLHNWAPGKAAAMGLDAEHLAVVRPGLVYAWASGWGDTFGADPPLGTDFMVQAYSGVAAAVGPTPSLMTLTDVLGGLVCAEGVLAGLLARQTSGLGHRVDSSLLSAAAVLLAAHTQHDSPRDPLRTADGYLALPAAAWAAPDRLASVFDLRCRDATVLQREPTASWVNRLADVGLAAVGVCTDIAAIASDIRFADALVHAECALPRPPWRFTR